MAIPGLHRSLAGPALGGPASQPRDNSPRPSSSAGAVAAPQPSAATAASPAPPAAPTNDDIEAVIKMAMASSSSAAAPRTNNPPRDTRTQLFVGNLPYRVRWQDLKDLFRRAGTVLRADVSLGPDNRSRGYGTVMLATAEDAGRAVDMFNGYCWQTRTLEVRPDRLGEELAVGGFSVNGGLGVGNHLAGIGLGMHTPSLNSSAGASTLPSPLGRYPGSFGVGVGEDGLVVNGATPMSRPSTGAGPSPAIGGPSRNLFVGNLPFHIQWQDLKDLFRQAGAVARADVALGADGRSRGFGTVAFATEADAERGVRMFNGYEFNGRPLNVHFDKFAAPSSSSAQVAVPVPHSPMGVAFALAHSPVLAHAHAHGLPLSHGASFAHQILQQQHEQAQTQRTPVQPFLRSMDPGYAFDSREWEPQREAPGHIGMPYRTAYDFEFLSSGPNSPYEMYGEAGGRSFFGSLEQRQQQQQQQPSLSEDRSSLSSRQALSRPSTSPQMHTVSNDESPDALPHSHSHTRSLSHLHSYPHAHLRSHSTQNNHAHSHGAHQQLRHTATHTHPHPAHPGPIALPPPPAVTAFPIPPAHTLSPPYPVALSPIHPAMSPLHHPAMMGIPMVSMTPHGLPPITPSMPSFTFLPQPSPGAAPEPSSSGTSTSNSGSNGAAYDLESARRAALHGHMLSPFGSAGGAFSPGATLSPGMSPGAFWGRPGAAANPFINPAVGAPVHSRPLDSMYYARGEEARTPDDEDAGAGREQGYFPPVRVSMAMAMAQAGSEPREPPGYFPLVPPCASALGSEAVGEDGSAAAGSGSGSGGGSLRGGEFPRLGLAGRRTSSTSEGTRTGADTGMTGRTPSSRGTSWTSEDLAKDVRGLAVDDETAALGPAAAMCAGAKPRAYSAVASQAPAMQTPSPGQLQRADSDPFRAAADGAAPLATSSQ